MLDTTWIVSLKWQSKNKPGSHFDSEKRFFTLHVSTCIDVTFTPFVHRQQSEEGEKNGSEDDDEEKPGKRVMGPRKKFLWDDRLRLVSQRRRFGSHAGGGARCPVMGVLTVPSAFQVVALQPGAGEAGLL